MLKKCLSLMVLALVLTAIGVSQAGEKVFIGMAIHSTDNEYWNQEAEGGKLFASTLPPGSAETQVLTCDGDDEKQLNGIKAFIASHGQNSIIYVDPSNAPNTAAIAEICEDAKVYWTSVWHLAEGLNPKNYQYYVMHQSVDGVKQGYDIAVKMFKLFKTPGKGKIVGLQGQLGNDSAVERYAGLQQALKEYPDVEFLDLQVCDWNPQRALNTTETWLAKYTDLDGIWSANDDMALGAIQALKAKGLNGKIKVVGVDGVSAAIDAIDAGDMVCTVANNGFLQGGYGAAYAYYAWAGKITPSKLPDRQRAFYTEGYLVEKANLAKYRQEFMNSVPTYDFTNLEFPVVRPILIKD
ncbi:MAG: sugar ABC transporter substrate-binding protein [Planctomycetota bacterium]|nr:sugar ABC transporter substrate-binding protein [Planctomycetota bacterium]